MIACNVMLLPCFERVWINPAIRRVIRVILVVLVHVSTLYMINGSEITVTLCIKK